MKLDFDDRVLLAAANVEKHGHFCALTIQVFMFDSVKEFKSKELGISSSLQRLRRKGFVEKQDYRFWWGLTDIGRDRVNDIRQRSGGGE